MRGKMDIVNEETKDEEMEDQGTITSSTTPTRASARLAAKLKQIMGTNTMQIPMSIETDAEDVDTKDPKKRARAPTLLPGTQATNSKKHTNSNTRSQKQGMTELHLEQME